MTLAACVALLPGMSDTFEWGGTTNPSSVTLRQEDGALAVVEFVNTIVPGFPTGFTLTAGELTVTVDIEHFSGSIPETMTVHPPEGVVAVPPVLVVEDGTTGTIRLFCLDALPLG
jgi:hypothetical protein